MSGLSLVAAFCTRDRPADLVRAARSLAASAGASGQPLDAVLIVDGGALTPAELNATRAALGNGARAIEYVDAKGPDASLLRSRLLALDHARAAGADYVAFFDDDVELDESYVARLRLTLAEGPAAAGGVDVLRAPASALRRAWLGFAGLAGSEPGRLSKSGFTEAQGQWLDQRDSFSSEFLSGCNMTVTVRVLDELPADALTQFRTYSLGEDLVLSAAARRIGRIVIDPRMRVRHHQSPAAREGRYEIGRQLVSNVRWMRERGIAAPSGLALWWSLGWLFARALAGDVVQRSWRGKAAGMLAGLRGER